MTTHGKLCRNCMAVEIPTRKTLCTECRDKLATERIETNKIYKRNKNRLKNPGKRYCQYKDCGKEIHYEGDMRVFMRTKYCPECQYAARTISNTRSIDRMDKRTLTRSQKVAQAKLRKVGLTRHQVRYMVKFQEI